jgi:hypothetical protein
MNSITIRDVSQENLEDFLGFCIPPDRRAEPAFVKGIEARKRWAQDMLSEYGSFAKLAYIGSTPVGIMEYESVPAERIVKIHCVFVPQKSHWRKGAAKALLSSLIDDMRKPKSWFGDELPRALVTRTFPGGAPDQYTSREFFTNSGFRKVGDDPDFLYYPVQEGFVYQPTATKAEYISREEDRGKALIIHGPSPCPFAYGFLLKTEQAIKKIAPDLPIRWIDKSEEPLEVSRRGNFTGCVVNAVPIKSFVLYTEGFKKEVLEALEN